MWHQKIIRLRPRTRGFHLITQEVVDAFPEISRVNTGLFHAFIQHSSASLTINENADPTVRGDFERFFRQSVPDDAHYFEHTYEGPDDMPAHLKASILGSSISVPVSNGALLLGTWQGIYLGEHRISAGSRRVVLTIQGESL